MTTRKSKKSIALFVDNAGEKVDISTATDIRVFAGQNGHLARIGSAGSAKVYRVANGVTPENLPELLKAHGFNLRGMTNAGRTALAHNYKFSK